MNYDIKLPEEKDLLAKLESRTDTEAIRMRKYLAMPDLSRTASSPLSEIVARGRNRFWAIANLETCLHLISELDDLTRMAVCLRTIQSAIEYSTNSSRIPIHAVNMLQIAEFIAEKKYPEVKKLREYV